MKKTLLIILAIITLCSFGNNKPHKIQRRQGILINTSKGIEFVPLNDWMDYTPKAFGDTVYQYKTT